MHLLIFSGTPKTHREFSEFILVYEIIEANYAEPNAFVSMASVFDEESIRAARRSHDTHHPHTHHPPSRLVRGYNGFNGAYIRA